MKRMMHFDVRGRSFKKESGGWRRNGGRKVRAHAHLHSRDMPVPLFGESDSEPFQNPIGSGAATLKARRTLEDIQEYYSPETILKILEGDTGWNHRVKGGYFHLRDRALVCVLYLCALRVSEALRLKKSQFGIDVEKQRVKVVGIMLSKRKEYSKEVQRGLAATRFMKPHYTTAENDQHRPRPP